MRQIAASSPLQIRRWPWLFSIGVSALVSLALLAVAIPSVAQTAAPEEADPKADMVVRSGLPIPRFVSLRSDEVNVRTGPGVRYPVEWVFVKKGMPVEITAEFDTWRRIRDWEGTQGWVHQSMLSGRRALVIVGEMRTLRREPSASADPVAQAEPGVIGRLIRCETSSWCEVELGGYRGWMPRADFWGTYPNEAVDD